MAGASLNASFPSPLSLACRLANRFGGGLARRFSLEPGELMRRARESTGLDDFGGEEFVEPLGVLTRSLEEDARLTLLGRRMARNGVLLRLGNRLRIQRDLAAHPEIVASPLPPVVFIAGLPRAGTTLLQRLLAQDPRNRTFQRWELMLPSPPPARETYLQDPRRELIRWQRQRWNRLYLTPDARRIADAIHPTGHDAPEECWLLLQNSFLSDIFSLFDRVPGYAQWLEHQDFDVAYRYYRRQLQLLTWRYSGERLVVKAPSHAAHLDSLFRVFPDARVLWTHRDPVQVVPSLCQLCEMTRRIRSDAVDPREIGASITARLRELVRRGMAFRAENDERPFLDISFAELVRSPLAVVRGIYRFLGQTLTEEAESKIEAWLRVNHPGPTRNYVRASPQRYGIAEADIRELYADYTRRFAAYLGR